MISFFKRHNTLSVFLFVLCVNLFFFSGHIGGDAIWNYLTAQSLFTDGNVNLADSIKEIKIAELHDSFEKAHEEIRSQKNLYGKVYSKYGFGSIIVGVVFYGAGFFFLKIFPFLPEDYFLIFTFSLQNVFVVSLLALVFFKLLKLFADERKNVSVLTFGFAFGTILFTYALKSGFGEPLAGLIILSGFYVINLYDRNKKLKYLFLSGFLTGFLLLTKIYTVVLFPAFFIFLCLVIEKKGIKNILLQIFTFLAGFIIPIIIFLAYNFMKFGFGNVFETGYGIEGTGGTFATEFILDVYYSSITLFNIFFSTGKGLFIFNPLIILSFFGIKNLFKNHKKQFVFYIAACVPYILFFSMSPQWPSYGAWGSRYFIPLLGILIFPAVFIFENIPESSGKRFVKALYVVIILGIFIQLPSVLMNYSAFERFLEKECPHSYRSRITMPQYSQIIGGYYQLFSGITRATTGESIEFPLILHEKSAIEKAQSPDRIDSNISFYRWAVVERKSLAGYDWFDLWFIHIYSINLVVLPLKFLTVPVVAFIAFASIFLFRQIMNN